MALSEHMSESVEDLRTATTFFQVSFPGSNGGDTLVEAWTRRAAEVVREQFLLTTCLHRVSAMQNKLQNRNGRCAKSAIYLASHGVFVAGKAKQDKKVSQKTEERSQHQYPTIEYDLLLTAGGPGDCL